MAYSIQRFSNFLVLNYIKFTWVHPDLDRALERFRKHANTKAIFASIDFVISCYKELTDEISIENFEKFAYETLPNKKQYMQYLLSRCLKLSEGDPTYFEFLLVCVYIRKMAECLFAKYKCCKILKLTANALEAVYVREYSAFFDKSGGFTGFADFCKNLNKSPLSMKYEAGEVEAKTWFMELERERNKKVENFKHLNDVDGTVELNSNENYLLTDQPYFIPNNRSDDYLFDWAARPDTPSEVAIFEIINNWEKVHLTNFRCAYCTSKCFQYPKEICRQLTYRT